MWWTGMIIMILGTIVLQPGDHDALTFVQGKYVISQLTRSWKLLWLCVDFLSFKLWRENLISV